MASEIKVDTIVNAGGDNDTGIDLATNDQILLKVANATKLTMNSTGQTTIVGEGGSTTTNMQQGLCKVFVNMDAGTTINDSFNVSSIADVGTGQHTINFTNAFGNTRHVPSSHGKENTSGSHDSGTDRIVGASRVAASASLLKITAVAVVSNNNKQDLAEIYVSIHGDLA